MADVSWDHRHWAGKTSLERSSRIKVSSMSKEPQVSSVVTVSEPSLVDGQLRDVTFNASPMPVSDIGVIIAGEDGRIRFYDKALQRAYWVRRLDAGIYASPISVPGKDAMIVASVKGMVVCLDLRGMLRWTTQLNSGIYGTPRVSPDGRDVILPVFGHEVVCLNCETGDTQWIFSMDAYEQERGLASHRYPYASPLVISNRRIIIADRTSVYCLSDAGGLLWTQNLGGVIRSTPVYAEGRIGCATSVGDFWILSEEGDVHGTIELGGRIDGSGAVSGSTAVISVRGVGTYGISLTSCEVLWVNHEHRIFEYTSVVPLQEELVMFTNDRGNVSCINASSGRFVWETSQVIGRPHRPTDLSATPMNSLDGSIYAVSYQGDCYRFD